MTVSEIQEAVRLADNALRSAKEAEKYAGAMVGGDKSGYASHAYTKAKQAVQELERLRQKLQTFRPS